MLNSKEINDRILRLSMIDTARNSKIALPIVMLLEVCMIISWMLNVDDKSSVSSLCYLVGYILMFVFSGIVVAFIHRAQKHIALTYRKIDKMQQVLAFVYLFWAVGFTFVGSELRGHFDYLIFITFVTMIPLFCYLNPIYWTCLQLAGTACVFYFASHFDRFFAFQINFSVFTLISIAAGWTMHMIRHRGYERQIELEDERNHAYKLAHKDSLTKLFNRQSFNEEFEKLKNDPNRENLIILMCDVNGLKPVNDHLGHDAGDELLKGAADCLNGAFKNLGTIYRVGGDEFTGILHGSELQLQDAIRKFDSLTISWKGKKVKQLSISIGHASVRTTPTASLSTLLTQADNAMYEAKRLYHQMHS